MDLKYANYFKFKENKNQGAREIYQRLRTKQMSLEGSSKPWNWVAVSYVLWQIVPYGRSTDRKSFGGNDCSGARDFK